MKTLFIPVTVSLLLLGACQPMYFESESSSADGFMETSQAEMKMSAAAPAPRSAQNTATQSSLLLAYRYHFSFAVPAKNLEAVSQ